MYKIYIPNLAGDHWMWRRLLGCREGAATYFVRAADESRRLNAVYTRLNAPNKAADCELLLLDQGVLRCYLGRRWTPQIQARVMEAIYGRQ